jgi:hypothetical protein
MRANGVETELRGGQVYRVLRLPAVMPRRQPAAAKTELRAPRVSAIRSDNSSSAWTLTTGNDPRYGENV